MAAKKPGLIKVGDKVVFNSLADATVFDVIEKAQFILTVREHGTENATQLIDVCAVVKKVN
jgi:ASC-1-like (ASCH) protein